LPAEIVSIRKIDVTMIVQPTKETHSRHQRRLRGRPQPDEPGSVVGFQK
jgi:hypothetical protein